MTQFNNDIFKTDFIQQNNIFKEKLFNKLDSLVKDASALMNINKNIYSKNANLSLSSNNKIENSLKEYIKFNEYISNIDNKEINSINENIIKEYQKITGISISRTEDLNLKINFNFLGEKNEYFIILSFNNDNFNVVDVNPKDINYKKYSTEHYNIKEITLFLCKLINYELIPHYQNKLNK